MIQVPVIAIDGDASSGKTSISKMLSKELGFYFLDSGILYRTMGYIKVNENVKFDSSHDINDILSKIKLIPDKEKYFRVNFNNIDITNQLYTEDIGQQASIVSQYSLVREALLVLQHSCVSKPGLIANGRDMGTKV
ncbi:MAG: (d)CMP kinase, partial [Pseudomonadota bacterium]|nr:(d)CMP kinase [Pseudomonadota bacterium]